MGCFGSDENGTFIERMSLDGYIDYSNMSEVSDMMKALPIIEASINSKDLVDQAEENFALINRATRTRYSK